MITSTPSNPSSFTTPTPVVTTLNHTVHVNASGYINDDDPDELGFTELQTIGIACVTTLVLLTLSLTTFFCFRFVWKNWRRNGEERTLRRTDSSDPNKSSHLLLPDEIKTSESQFSVIPPEELEEVLTTYNSAPSDLSIVSHNHTRKSTANGSIITMTMENNHLIVETEERIPGGFEETCLLVDASPVEEEDSTALIHRSQEQGKNTGLSQSDLSVSSGGSANPRYCYGNQLEYLGDETVVTQVQALATVRAKVVVPFLVQPSQDIEDDELYLEQQHQLGKGVEDSQAVPSHCTPFENPGFVATPEQPKTRPVS